MFWSQNTKWQRARETNSDSNSKWEDTKNYGTLKMKRDIKRESTFWHRFFPILKKKIVVLEALKIDREMKFDSFVNNILYFPIVHNTPCLPPPNFP